MPTQMPVNLIEDALSLTGDGLVDLYELNPVSGGSVFFKADNDITWLGDEYMGLPCTLTGEERDTEKTAQPQMTIGQENLDLLPFKALVHDGYLDGASLTRRRVKVDDLVANLNIKQVQTYRVKRVENYSRTHITLSLATFSGAITQVIPFRQYVPPAYPYVEIK